MFDDDETLTMPTVYVYADGQYLDLDAYMMMGNSPSFADGELRFDTILVQTQGGTIGTDPSPGDGVYGLRVWEEGGELHFEVEKPGWFDHEIPNHVPNNEELEVGEGITGKGSFEYISSFIPFESQSDDPIPDVSDYFCC